LGLSQVGLGRVHSLWSLVVGLVVFFFFFFFFFFVVVVVIIVVVVFPLCLS
jgi:hypothetical protein